MRLRVWLSLLILFACAGASDVPGSAGAGSDLPDAATLQAKVDAIAEAAPPNYRETIVDHDDDGDHGQVIYHRFDDWRAQLGSGRLQEQSGEFQHEHWKRDPNGVTVVDDDPPPEPHTLTVTRTGPPDTYVLASLTKQGYGTRTYVDAQTLREQRVVETDAIGTTTTTIASYGTFGGYTLPATWTTTTKSAGTTATDTFTRRDVVLGGVTADDVAEPPTGDLVTFPEGKSRVDLPATFDGGRVLLHGTIAGQAANFLLDSGSAVITISPGLAHRIGATIVDTAKLSGAGTVSVKEAVIPVLQIGALTMHDVVASIIPVGTYGFNDEEYGVIGFDFLATLAVTVDFLHQHVTAESGWDYHAAIDSSTFPLPLRLGGFVPMTSAAINGAHVDRLVVDTGADATLMLFNYFSRAHPEIFDKPEFADTIFTGIGGSEQPEEFSFRTIKLGHLTLENFNGYRTSLDSHAFNWEADGLFGSDFLRHFTVVFDFVHAQILLRQNHDGGLLPVGR